MRRSVIRRGIPKVRYKLIQIDGIGNGKLYRRVVSVGLVLPMDSELFEWKLAVDRIWSAATPDYGEAARLVADIAGASRDAILRQAATQALPILRSAAAESADRTCRTAARRRLGVILTVLHTLTAPRFGRRPTGPPPATAEQRYRQVLGLPLGRPLSAAEIHRAYKRVAKRAHPDAGGSAREFVELSAARDGLMKAK
jgi:hypothetical protein